MLQRISEKIKRFNKPIFILFIIIILPSCSPDKPKDIPKENINDGITYIPNMKTPYNSRLLPAEEGFFRSVFEIPEIDLNNFKLEIDGLVDSSYYLTWKEITNLPKQKTEIMLMYCVDGWEVWGAWEGVLVKDLLNTAKVKSNGKYVLFSSADGGYSTSLPISYLEKYNAILAMNVNGSPLNQSDGFPLRLIAFGKFGYKWIKWVNKLEVIESSQAGYWENDGYSDEANVPLDRRKYYEGENAQHLEY